MISLAELIKELREAKGTQVVVADALGISSQLLGRYEKGKHKPKLEFYESWKAAYNEDIVAILRERNASRETKNKQNTTLVPNKPPINKKDPYEEIRILIRNLDRMGETNEYLLKRIRDLGG